MENFGSRLIGLRNSRNLNRAEAASQMGVTEPKLRYWEMGKANPPLDSLRKISRFYGVSLHWLIEGEGPQTKESIELLFDPESPDVRDHFREMVPHVEWRLWRELYAMAVVRLAEAWELVDQAKATLADPKASAVAKQGAEVMLLTLKNRMFVDPDDGEAAEVVAEYRQGLETEKKKQRKGQKGG